MMIDDAQSTVFATRTRTHLETDMKKTTLTLLAALQAVPPELYEAAHMDGAGRGQRLMQAALTWLWSLLSCAARSPTVISLGLAPR